MDQEILYRTGTIYRDVVDVGVRHDEAFCKITA
jgi:hypothetical protein